MSGETLCELCGARGVKSRLIAFQINLEEAMLLCENNQCVFPLGSSVTRAACLTLQRKAAEISNCKRKKKRKTQPIKPKIATQTGAETSEVKEKTIDSDNFLQWQNMDALCWLDCVLNMLVHNRSIQQMNEKIASQDSRIKLLLSSYKEALDLLPDNLCKARDLINTVRQTLWNYLKPKMHCELGVNDSPIFALPLLLRENTITSESCLQEVTWHFRCTHCGCSDVTRLAKHLITFPNTPDEFSLPQGSFVKKCNKCGSEKQKSVLEYDRAPSIALLHFVEGLKSADYLDYKFDLHGKRYEVTQFIQYSQDPDHFISWTRHQDGSKWMELDDLKASTCSWSNESPRVPPSEVHILVLESLGACKPLVSMGTSMDVASGMNTGSVCAASTSRYLDLPSNKSCIDIKAVSLEGSDIRNCHDRKESEALQFPSVKPSTISQNSSLFSSLSLENSSRLPRVNVSENCIVEKTTRRSCPVAEDSLKGGASKVNYSAELQRCDISDNNLGCSNPKSQLVSNNVSNIQTRVTAEQNTVSSNVELHSDTHRKTYSKSEPSKVVRECVPVLPPVNTSLLQSCTDSAITASSSQKEILNNTVTSTIQPIKDITPKRQSSTSCQLLHRKRRQTSTHFQPYVPKKLRQSVSETPPKQEPEKMDVAVKSPLGVDKCMSLWQAVAKEKGLRGVIDDSHSDSGYSSPSSVSSCSSSQPLQTSDKVAELLDNVANDKSNDSSDIVAELSALLPDSLLLSRSRTPSPIDHAMAFDVSVKPAANTDDDFLLSLVN